MKALLKSIILFCVISVSFLSCETYSDPKISYSPIYPISGEWRVRITNLTTGVLVSTTSMYTFDTYNTSDNLTNQMWIRCSSSIPFTSSTAAIRTVKSKINCDVAGLTFATTGVIQNLNVTTNAVVDTLVITEGKITLNSVTMPSLVKSDRISFKLAKTKVPGITYFVEGYRRTQWNEDETFITFQ
jgi:hypothetical protein